MTARIWQVHGLLISSGYREDHPPENAVASEVFWGELLDGWMEGWEGGKVFFLGWIL